MEWPATATDFLLSEPVLGTDSKVGAEGGEAGEGYISALEILQLVSVSERRNEDRYSDLEERKKKCLSLVADDDDVEKFTQWST